MNEVSLNKKYNSYSESQLRSMMLAHDEDSDEAAFYLIRYRMHAKFKAIYDRYHLPDEFGDVLMDFFLYLRNGKTGNNEEPYKGMKGLISALAFNGWLKRTFSNFIADKDTYYKRQHGANVEYQKESCEKTESRESEIKMMCTLVAWMVQECTSEERFMLYRHLIDTLSWRDVIENKRVAEVLKISYGNYRVRSSRLDAKMHGLLSRLKKGEKPALNEECKSIEKDVYDNFGDVRSVLADLYEKNLPNTSFYEDMMALRQKDLEESKARRAARQAEHEAALARIKQMEFEQSIVPGNTGMRFSLKNQPQIEQPKIKYSLNTDCDLSDFKIPVKDFSDLCPRRRILKLFLADTLETEFLSRTFEINNIPS